MAGEISPGVRRFIHSTINSVEQLEVLLFLMSNPDQEWSPEQISERTRLPVESVAQKLEDLLSAQLLTVRRSAVSYFRYEPNSPALAQEVAESLDQAYREGKDTVVQLIFSKPLDNIKVFADAFRIKRDHS